ncbi:MAG: LamG domain-containing protein, partial [Actinomycetota bacterium]
MRRQPHSRRAKHVRIARIIAGVALLGIVAALRVAIAAPPDNSLSLNGSSGYVRIPQAASTKFNLSSFTLEAWFNRTSSTSVAGTTTTTSSPTGSGLQQAITLVAKGRGEAEGSNLDFNYFFGIDDALDRLAVDYEEGAGQAQPAQNHSFIGSTTITAGAGVWHHAAATFDATTGTWKLYLDGRLDGTSTVGAGRAPRSDSVQDIGIGAALQSFVSPATGAPAGFFNGSIDELRIWNGVRTWEQIRDTKNDELTTSSDPGATLVARYGLDEGAATTAGDSIAPARNGTLTAATWTTGQYAFTQDNTPPAAPAGAAAVARNAAVDLSWTANSEPDLAGYNIYRSTSPGVPTNGTPLNADTLLAANATSFTDSTASNGTTYYYAVTAVDTANNKGSSEVFDTPSASLTALRLNGTNQYVTFGQATSELGATSFTLETWFKRTGTGI